ncbi:tetratricopeptide repeat-containing sulfotransferase family protein [Synechococcus sp. BIOS-E4-1]|uniref:tetratricopeptide repeat-containing sulfotransferase family protein n=1 Tax=Synechococcus sp. BIOS-E4-1 TaxID=1400864 RepID=UPI0016447F5F|nr:tetratricopeptide repeat-containing sulfotransferase family protein [Synechococcus sp. BIOS-E4-1]
MLALEQFEKAQQCLVKAYQLDGSDPETAKDIGSIFLRLGNQNTALAWYEQALEIDNDYAPALNNIANIKRDLGSNHEAIDMYKRAIEIDPKLIQAYKGAAISFVVLGDLDHAASFAKQALAINASTPGINEILGIVFQNKSNPGQAFEYYQKELEINPKASNSLLNLGALLLQKGQFAAAVESLSKASTLAPSEHCFLLLAQAYQNLGKFKEAIAEYKKLDIGRAKNKMIPFNLGLCLLKTGNNIDAIEVFQIAVQLDKSFTPAWGNIGTALMNEGRHQEALTTIQKVLDLDPGDPTVHMILGGICKELGQLDQALAATLKSLELKPDNSDALMNLGGIYKEFGQLDQALTATLKSLELQADNPDALMTLGGIYKELGQLDQALAATLKSLVLKPDNPTVYMNLGGIYKEFGQLDQALAATLKSLELKPDIPDALMNLGGIYKELGNFKEANKAIGRSFDSKKLTLSLAIQGFEYYDSSNQTEKLKQAIENANKLFGSHNTASAIYNARLLFHDKEYKASLEALEAIDVTSLVSAYSSIRYYFFRGLTEEKLGLHEQAFNHFILAQKDERYRNITPTSSWDSIKSYKTLAVKIKPILAACPYPINSPVFLIGFPRSGTTLLDTVLRSHPSVEVVEEKDQLAIAEKMAIREFGKKIEDFADLEKAQLERLRREYLKRLHSQVKDPVKTIIDKLPLNIVKTPLVKILFPNAKMILAIRHPCDSVLSCFQQTFEPNPSMANFNSLEGSIIFYSKVMTAWNKYCNSFPIDHHIIRYEDLVEDFNGSMTKVLDYLDIEWNDSIKDYRRTALKRGSFNTPSATQVAQPLYRTSIGKWRNYRGHFEEYFPLLNPWIKQWRYT